MKPLPIRAAEDLLRLLHQPVYRNQRFKLWLSYFEIYGGKLFDLLCDRKYGSCMLIHYFSCFPGIVGMGTLWFSITWYWAVIMLIAIFFTLSQMLCYSASVCFEIIFSVFFYLQILIKCCLPGIHIFTN